MTALGLFVDLRRLDGSRRTATAHTARTIELLVEAERLGCEAAWFTEHHGFSDGYLSQPLVLAAAVAARTTTMRLGTAVTLGPLRHPRHLAEEAALVDVISGGRLELGLGAGYAQSEYDAFGVDMERRFHANDRTLQEIRRLLSEGEAAAATVQQPLPLWSGYQAARGARRAGRTGTGLLSLDPALLEPYRDGLREGGHDPEGARMGGLVEIIVADDPEAAAQRLAPHWVHQQNSYRSLRRRSDGSPLPLVTAEDGRAALASTGRLGNVQVLDIANSIAELRRRIEPVPARHAYAWLSLADMPGDLVERHIELWCGPVRQGLTEIDCRSHP